MRAPARQAGFSLLEVLVAFVILALSLGVILQIVSTGLRNAVLAEEYAVASAYASSKLAELSLQEASRLENDEGEFESGHGWRVEVREFPLDDEEEWRSSLVLYLVRVSVSWGTGRDARVFELETLRSGAKQ